MVNEFILKGVVVFTFLIAVICLVLLYPAAHTCADYEGIKDWDEDLICFPVSITGKRGEPIVLKWNNFLTFDENSKMVFLKLDKGLHKVPSRGFVCMPEDSVDNLWPEGE